MQMVWKKNKRSRTLQPCPANLPFQSEPDDEPRSAAAKTHPIEESGNSLAFSELLQSQGNSLAEVFCQKIENMQQASRSLEAFRKRSEGLGMFKITIKRECKVHWRLPVLCSVLLSLAALLKN